MNKLRVSSHSLQTRTNGSTPANRGIAIWSNDSVKRHTMLLPRLDELPRLSNDSRISAMAPREFLCNVEEAKGKRALAAIEDAINTLQQVLDDYEVEEENGGSSAGSD
jgi:hypothetical protein